MIRFRELYFEWLTEQILTITGKTYTQLFEKMYNYEFVWLVAHDDNRIQDAMDLRVEFEHETEGRVELPFVSVLEVLVALSRRLAFNAGGNPPTWAWQLVKNLHLEKMFDPMDAYNLDKLEEILNVLVWRTYRPDGKGGFFPLKNPEKDQRGVEIWYQMNAYIDETQNLRGGV